MIIAISLKDKKKDCSWGIILWILFDYKINSYVSITSIV